MGLLAFKKILVPLDGSELAGQALEPAMALIEETGGEVILLGAYTEHHLVATTTTGLGMEVVDEPLALPQRYLASHLAMVQAKQARPHIDLQVRLIEGDAASAIVDAAAAEDVDLIVMSTHGRSGLTRWLLGSVTAKVLRSAPCPLLVMRRAEPLAHILITLDGSAVSESALAPGFEVAERLHSQVTLLSVEQDDEVDPRLVAELDRAEMGLGQQVSDDFYHRTEKYMQDVARVWQKESSQQIGAAIRSGRAAEAILQYVESKGVDLVVMATHGRTGLRRWVYGSVTTKILRGADCALLVVRPPDIALV